MPLACSWWGLTIKAEISVHSCRCRGDIVVRACNLCKQLHQRTWKWCKHVSILPFCFTMCRWWFGRVRVGQLFIERDNAAKPRADAYRLYSMYREKFVQFARLKVLKIVYGGIALPRRPLTRRQNRFMMTPIWQINALRFALLFAVMAQWWEHWPCTNVAQVRFPDRSSYVSWACWFSTLLREIFPRVLRFSPLTKYQYLIWYDLSWFDFLSPQLVEPPCSAKHTLTKHTLIKWLHSLLQVW